MAGLGGINGDISVDSGVRRTGVCISGVIGDISNTEIGIGDITICVYDSGGGGVTADAGESGVTNDEGGGLIDVKRGDVMWDSGDDIFGGGVVYRRSIIIAGGVIIENGKASTDGTGTCMATSRRSIFLREEVVTGRRDARSVGI